MSRRTELQVLKSQAVVDINDLPVEKVVVETWCHSGPVSVTLESVRVFDLLDRLGAS